MQRPATVPAEAVWQPSDNEWMLAETDDEGRKHGLTIWWRPDGTKCCATEYHEGSAHGSCERFHENGETSRTGPFVKGQLHGTHRFIRSTESSTENFPRGLPDAVWACEMDYVQGSVNEARAYNAQGERIREDGSPFPEASPKSVPNSAHFKQVDDVWQWVDGSVRDNLDGTLDRIGEWRWWSEEGELLKTTMYVDGSRHGQEITYEDGETVSTTTYTEGSASGPFERPVEPGIYGVAAVRERGTLLEGDVTGTLSLLGADGAVVGTATLGRKASQDTLASIMAGELGVSDLGRLDEESRFAAALFTVFVARRPLEEVTARIQAMQPPLSEEGMGNATQRGEYILDNVQRLGGRPVAMVSSMLDAIRLGGDPGDLLRHCAAKLDDRGASKVASALIDAACAIDAEFAGHEYTRALIRMSLGDATGAMASIQRLEDEGFTDAVVSLRPYCRAIFEAGRLDLDTDPRFELAARVAEHMTKPAAALPPLEKVRSMMQQIATRVNYARQNLIESFGEQDWIPASMNHLLPDGPVEVELPEESGIGLMHAVRHDLLRFRWLCWPLGLDGSCLPDAIEVDETRPSSGGMLVIVGRALLLNGQEPNVGDWLGDTPAAQAIVATVLENVGAQEWFGLELAHCPPNSRSFAMGDERVLFDFFVNGWMADETPYDD